VLPVAASQKHSPLLSDTTPQQHDDCSPTLNEMLAASTGCYCRFESYAGLQPMMIWLLLLLCRAATVVLMCAVACWGWLQEVMHMCDKQAELFDGFGWLASRLEWTVTYAGRQCWGGLP
jgi:hypothetical protein